MLSAHAAFVAFSLALAGCTQLAATEQKVIGTWQSHSMDAAWQLSLQQDHMLLIAIEVDGAFSPAFAGRWRLEGTELILNITHSTYDTEGLPSDLPKTMRKRIVAFASDQLTIEGEYPYTRVK